MSKKEELRSELLEIGVKPEHLDMVLAVISREVLERAQTMMKLSTELVKEISLSEGKISSIR